MSIEFTKLLFTGDVEQNICDTFLRLSDETTDVFNRNRYD